MKKVAIGIILLGLTISFTFPEWQGPRISPEAKVSALLEQLGENYSAKKPNLTIKNVSPRIGEDIVKNGFSKREDLAKARRQSKHFVCTSCHNVVKEDPNLAMSDPQARLNYTVNNGIPFLQATTLYGAVNRTSYYNGDYEKKYGELITPARNNIREAIQLCALECAQGRKLDEWELESILAYLWEIELRFKDLIFSDAEMKSIEQALSNENLKVEVSKLIQSKYLEGSPATFVLPPPDRSKGYGMLGNPANGKLIYEKSCLHCHYQKRYSFLHLDSNKMSFRHLNSKISGYHRHSIYQVVRYGTYSKYGKKSYMPHYTAERMSDQMLEDLRAYIELEAS